MRTYVFSSGDPESVKEENGTQNHEGEPCTAHFHLQIIKSLIFVCLYGTGQGHEHVIKQIMKYNYFCRIGHQNRLRRDKLHSIVFILRRESLCLISHLKNKACSVHDNINRIQCLIIKTSCFSLCWSTCDVQPCPEGKPEALS